MYGTQATKLSRKFYGAVSFEFKILRCDSFESPFKLISKFATCDLNNMKSKPNMLNVNKKT